MSKLNRISLFIKPTNFGQRIISFLGKHALNDVLSFPLTISLVNVTNVTFIKANFEGKLNFESIQMMLVTVIQIIYYSMGLFI